MNLYNVFVYYVASHHTAYLVDHIASLVFGWRSPTITHNLLCRIKSYIVSKHGIVSSYSIQPVMLYKATLYVIISPILSLSQLLQCLDLQLMLLQNKRCRGVNWVKDREDYLGLCCCQALSLTHSVRVAIWQLYSTASLSSWEGKKR